MCKYLWILAAVLLTLPGCRNRNAAVSPAERMTLTLDVAEAAPPPKPGTGEHNRVDVPRPRRTDPAEINRTQPAKRRGVSSLPYSSGKMDSELNATEQEYLNGVRQRHQQQVRDNERRVFGDFSLFGK